MCRSAALLALVLLVSSSAHASQSSGAEKEEGPDYSHRGLLEFVQENVDLEAGEEEGFDVDMGIVYRKGHWLFRYVPIIAPFVVSHAPDANALLMPTVDPFVLTGNSIPYTNSTFRDRWEERRIRRYLRKNVESANRAQNQ